MVPAIIHDIASSVRSPEYANDLAKQAGAEVGFSATELLGCPRQYRLKKQHPYWEKPSGMYRMTFGSGYHAALSKYSAGIAEETLTWKFKLLGKSVLLVGTPDLIELRARRLVHHRLQGHRQPALWTQGSDLQSLRSGNVQR